VRPLSFLSPVANDDVALARVPAEGLARAAGGTFERRDGWNVAVDFPQPDAGERGLTQTVAFADRSHVGKLELHGAPADLGALLRGAADGEPELPGNAWRTSEGWLCPLTASRALVLFDTACEAPASSLAAEALARRVAVVDMTCGLAAVALAGPAHRELVARLCAIDLRPSVVPVGGFRPGSIARTPGYVLREREDSLLLLVGWALGEYLWQVVADAAERLGGGPVGADVFASRREYVDA
jgi:heterotetrameric sarcosine oxidase gamma subunit